MEKYQNIILGAGIAGLAAANELDKDDTLVLEAEGYYGGLCHSFEVNGFWFDTAIHLSFTEKETVREVFDKTPYIAHKPIAYNFYKGLWLKHPVLNNLYRLPVQEKIECIKDLIERKMEREINSYRDWLRASYGEKLCEEFYDVYTRKYWTAEPEELSVTWVGNRLNTAEWDKILLGAFQEETGMDYYAKEMRYPKEGRYETFLKPLSKNINLKLDKKVIRVDSAKKIVFCADGTQYGYEKIISTLPLPELIKLLGEVVPVNILQESKKLQSSCISLVSVGLKKEDIQPYLWFYVYDEDMMTARVNAPSIKSAMNVPKGYSSLQFEIYHNPAQELPDKETLMNNVKYSLEKMKICNEDEILFMHYKFVPYGNVIFYQGMEKDRDNVIEYLKNQGIETAGRFGEWEYFWSDQSYLSGKKAAQRVKNS